MCRSLIILVVMLAVMLWWNGRSPQSKIQWWYIAKQLCICISYLYSSLQIKAHNRAWLKSKWWWFRWRWEGINTRCVYGWPWRPTTIVNGATWALSTCDSSAMAPHTTRLYTVKSHSSPWKWVQLRGTWLKWKAVVEFNGKDDADNKGSTREHGCVEVYHNGEWSTANNCKWLLNDG